MLKVLIVVTSHALLGVTGKPTGYYLSEVSHPYHELSKAGIKVEFASIQGGDAPVDPKSLENIDKDLISKSFWNNQEIRKKLKNTKPLKSFASKDFSGVLFAGGHGTMWDFRGHKEVARIVKEIYESNGVVAAVCHGPSSLLDIKLSNGKYLVEGKKVAAFTNSEEDAVKLTKVMPYLLETELKKNGALFIEAKDWSQNVQVSERLITGQNPASASLVGKEISKILLRQKK